MSLMLEPSDATTLLLGEKLIDATQSLSTVHYIHFQTSVPMKNTDDYVPHVRARFLERLTKEN